MHVVRNFYDKTASQNLLYLMYRTIQYVHEQQSA